MQRCPPGRFCSLTQTKPPFGARCIEGFSFLDCVLCARLGSAAPQRASATLSPVQQISPAVQSAARVGAVKRPTATTGLCRQRGRRSDVTNSGQRRRSSVAGQQVIRFRDSEHAIASSCLQWLPINGMEATATNPAKMPPEGLIAWAPWPGFPPFWGGLIASNLAERIAWHLSEPCTRRGIILHLTRIGPFAWPSTHTKYEPARLRAFRPNILGTLRRGGP